MRRTLIIGAFAWLLTPVMYAAEVVTMWRWTQHYSLAVNTISDLGSTSCGTVLGIGRDNVYVCSPWHAVMNGAFVLGGALTLAGALLVRPHWPVSGRTALGLLAVGAAGVGAVVIGLAPADQNLPVHAIGALLQVPGAAGPLLLASVTPRGAERRFSLAVGVIGTAASVLFLTGIHLGIGPGGMERLAFEPLTAWTGALGAVMLAAAGRPRSAQPVQRTA
jgi:hypothetical membrane protein